MPAFTRSSFTLIVVVLAAACGGEGPSAPPPTETTPEAAAQSYLDGAINLMRDSSYYSSRVDWTAVRAAAHAQAAGSTTYAATYPAIRTALAALGDRHSSLQPPAPGASADRVAFAAHPADSLDGELLGGRYGYVRVPTFAPASDSYQLATAFADTIQGLVRAVDGSAPCGWVVDLRHSLGRSVWPMLTGIGPILGAGSSLGSFLDSKGTILTWWYNYGAAGLTNEFGVSGETMKVSGAPYVVRAQNPPVAVLTDSLTAAGGEGLVIAFRGRSSTRSFGAATSGVPTSTRTIRLADGAMLVLTQWLYRDRNGRPYDTSIAPDEPVAQSGAPATDDATVAAATAWLATQPACAAQ
jgi:hypothetical protein